MASQKQPDSLVMYGNPIMVSTTTKAGQKAQGKKKQQLPPIDKPGSSTRNEDYLNSILPPREYTENGHLWVRYVEPTPATKIEVMNLQDNLDKKLQERQARETGICPIREELYA
jgi:dynein light intermediate chain